VQGYPFFVFDFVWLAPFPHSYLNCDQHSSLYRIVMIVNSEAEMFEVLDG
jgi:hypothetical protein